LEEHVVNDSIGIGGQTCVGNACSRLWIKCLREESPQSKMLPMKLHYLVGFETSKPEQKIILNVTYEYCLTHGFGSNVFW